MVLLDGKKTSNDIKNEITTVVQEMKKRGERSHKIFTRARVFFKEWESVEILTTRNSEASPKHLRMFVMKICDMEKFVSDNIYWSSPKTMGWNVVNKLFYERAWETEKSDQFWMSGR